MRHVSEVVAHLARLGARAEGLFTEARQLQGAETLLTPLELKQYLDGLQGAVARRAVGEEALADVGFRRW